jgi:hypothetical protein
MNNVANFINHNGGAATVNPALSKQIPYDATMCEN